MDKQTNAMHNAAGSRIAGLMRVIEDDVATEGTGTRIDDLVRVVENAVASSTDTEDPSIHLGDNPGPIALDKITDVASSTSKEAPPINPSDHSVPSVPDIIIDVDGSPLKLPLPGHRLAHNNDVIDVDGSPLKLHPPMHRKDEIINIDGSPLKLKLASDGTATPVVDLDNIEINIDNSLDDVLLRHVYAFEGAGKEFFVNPTDKKGFKGSIFKKFTAIDRNGYGEIDLVHFKSWFRDLRFASMLTDNGKHVKEQAWHFKLLMMYPTASQIHFKANTQNKNNVTSFLPKLKKFYQDLFLNTMETRKTIALAVDHDISFVIVGQLCDSDSIVTPFWQANKQSLKVISAVTFRPVLVTTGVPKHVNVHVSWLGVKGNVSQPPPPEGHQGWRRQGFGLFMLQCLIKAMYAGNPLTETVDIYLPCCERQTNHCYRKLGFQQLNEFSISGKLISDGFEQLPMEMQDMLLRKPSTGRTAGQCLFHFYFSDFHKKPYRLLLLRSGCLRYFQETETGGSDSAVTSSIDKVSPAISNEYWCQYPSNLVNGKRYEYDSSTIRGWFKELPLITDLLPPPHDFTLPSSTIGMSGKLSIARRVLMSTPTCRGGPPGDQWFMNYEIDLMLTTLLWDGRYQDACTVCSSTDTQVIESAYDALRHYREAYQMYADAECAKKKDPTFDMEEVKALIIQRYKFHVHQLYENAQSQRNWLINGIIARNPTLLSRRLIAFPRNESNAHWSCIFVFNASHIERANETDALQPCFFKYCSLHITGERKVHSQAIPWFLNLCYSVKQHEKTHSINSGVPLVLECPYGPIDFGSMVGTNAFPALKFPVGSQYLPRQKDGFNCGMGVVTAVGIMIRDVIHKGSDRFDDVFSVNRMPLDPPLDPNGEVYCAMPEVFFTSLATKIEGDYLALIREQWFTLFDNMAASQHVHEPIKCFGDYYTVSQEYTNAVEQCKGWPQPDLLATKRYLGKRSPRKVPPPKAALPKVALPKVATDMPQSDNTKRLDLAMEQAKRPEEDNFAANDETSIPQSDSPRPSDNISKIAQPNEGAGHGKTRNDGIDVLVDTDDEDEDEVKSSKKVRKAARMKAVSFLQETDTEFKLNDAGKQEYLNGVITISRMDNNGVLVPVSDDRVIRSAGNGQVCEIEDVEMFTESVNFASRPMAYLPGKVKRPAKRKLDDVEVTAEFLLNKIKERSEKDYKAFQAARSEKPKRGGEQCLQSRAFCDEVYDAFGTDMPKLTELNESEYQEEMDQYIESSFKAWGWHSRKEHLLELAHWGGRIKNPLVPLSKAVKVKIALMIKALKNERLYYTKRFANEFKFTQKTLVRSVKFDEVNDTFVALLGWIQINPVFETPKKQEGNADGVVKPTSYSKVEKREKIVVEKEWVREQFGEVMYQQIVNMRQDPAHMWVLAPRDVEMYIGKDKILSVRYVSETIMHIVDTQALSKAIEKELAEHAKMHQSVERKRVRTRRAPHKLPLATNTEVPFVPKAQLDPPRMPITVPAKWTGKINNGKIVVLDEDFVRASFGNAFADEMKKVQKGFVDIPVGDFKVSRLHCHPHLVSSTCPRITFMQEEGKDLCVSKSLASAFFSLGWHDEGKNIDDFGESILKGFAMKALEQVGVHSITLFPPWIVINRMQPTFNWKSDLWSTDVFVGVLLASDGSCSHAVTIHGGYVFDANEKVAMILCDETLDYCTSTETVKTTFVRFKRGYLYRVHGKKKNRIARMTLMKDDDETLDFY